MNRFIIRLNKEERKKLNKHLLDENYATWSKCGYAIGIFQILMLISNLTGGTSWRTPYYRWMYIALLIATLIAKVSMNVFRKHEDTIDYFYAVAGMYMFAVFVWSMGITLIGFGTKQDLSTYAYATISACAIILLEPYLVALLMITCTTVLGVLLFSRPAFDVGVGTIIQLCSICSLAVIVSCVAYNRRLQRVRLEYAQKKNLQKISNLNRQLQNEAIMDALTGLYNRRYLTEHIELQMISGEKSTGVLMIDIDFFKKINDTYGHQKGDECLVVLGKLIREIVEEKDSYAVRYGGEEFLVYYERISESDLLQHAEDLQNALKQIYVKTEESEIHITVSIGYALADRNMQYAELIGNADKNLYLAKNNGRNIIWPPVNESKGSI